MENAENRGENAESIEKPKKKMSEAQLKNLEKMRHKRAVKAEAKKMINAAPTAPAERQTAPADHPKYESSDFVRLSEDVQYIKDYIKTRKEMKESKHRRDDSIDKKTSQEEDESYKYLMYQQQLRKNFIR